MKKLIYFLFCLLVFMIQTEVKAEEYKISDLNMTLFFEDSWTTITRDNYKENEILKKFNITEEEMETIFTTKNAYVDAVDKNGIEVFIRATGSELEKNLFAYKDKDLESYADSLKDKTGASDYEFVKYNDIKYVVLSYRDEDMNCYILEAHTIVDKKAITITYQFPKEFTEEEKQEFDTILSSLKIDFIDISRNKKDLNIPMILGGIIVISLFGIGYVYIKRKKEKN